MTRSEFIGLETQLKAQLARADQGLFLIRQTLEFAGVMALVLAVADATPWPLGQERPVLRLVFIFFWSAAMSTWQLRRLRHSHGTGAGIVDSA